MRKTAYRVLILLVLVCTVAQPLSVCAAQTVDVNRKCSLELEYSGGGTGFAGLEIRLFRIAEMDPDGNYALTAPFDALPVKIHGITSQKEWRDTANTLAAYIAAQQIPPTETAVTDTSGKAAFADLQTGVWLVLGVSAETEQEIYQFENFCVFLPRPQADGSLDYDLQAKPKHSVTPKPDKPDAPQEICYQVVKLWKDAGIRDLRPKSVTVAILKNGKLQETVSLNPENSWTYSWLAPEDNAVWTVVETDVPDDYTVVIHTDGTTFTVTNSRPAPVGVPPKTGDTFALRPWLMTMSLSGILLLALGILQKRKRG